MNMKFLRKLPIPLEIKERYPLTDEIINIKKQRDEEIKNIFLSKSDKFILIIGPCSADRKDAVLDYVNRLKEIQEEVKDVILIIPRIYTNKPRTTGFGYKGMLHQPDPTSNPDMLKGLIAIRELHIEVVKETGLTAADEILYPENYRYLSDILSYASIGARSVEDQQHRLTASGLNIPVGLKNPLSGDLSSMINAVNTARNSHMFIYRGWEVVSEGNTLAHAILRGYKDINGNSISNYSYDDLIKVYDLFKANNIENGSVIVDVNHCNSNKDYLKQIDIANDVMQSINKDKRIYNMVKGLMIESYIEDGAQNIEDGIYGKSITDPCLGWEKTKELIRSIAKQRREIK